MIWPILEARAEIQKYFRSFFGSNEDIQKSSWNYLTFKEICGEEFLHQNTLDIHKQQPNCSESKPELFKPLKLDEDNVSDGEEKNKKGNQKETKEDLEDSWLYLSDSSSNSGSELDEPVVDDSSNQDMKLDESMTNDVVLGEKSILRTNVPQLSQTHLS